jgi:hypothetical protein
VEVVGGEQHALGHPVTVTERARIRGSRTPRNSSSSPSTVLKIPMVMKSPNQCHEPSKRA